MPNSLYSRAFRRAAQSLGGVEALRAHLGVGMSDLNRWMQGEARPPDAVFLRVVDLLADQDLAEIKQGLRDQSSPA